MLGTSTLIGSAADGGSSAHEGGGVGGVGGVSGEVIVGPQGDAASIMTATGIGDDEKSRSGGDLFEGDRSTGGNRWPRQETLALLKIRSDMDVVFRDSSLKGPLWEEVSRKMAELGYHRSAKKCKEKFENVYKYHKRTKDGRVGKSDGKTYRFFDQLEALEQHHLSITASSLPPMPQPSPQATPRAQAQSQAPAQAAVPVTMVIPAGTNPATVTVSSSPHPISVVHTTSVNPPPQQTMNQVMTQLQPPSQSQPPPPPQQPQLPQVIQQHQNQHQHHQQTMGIPTHSSIQMENMSSPSATQSSSSSTSSDEELMGRRKRKRKWKDFFERLMKEVIDKQEELQKRFLEAVEKREHDRVVREEAWKMQEMTRLNREHEILVQERSMAAAKDAALIAFLQKLSDQQQIPLPLPVQVQSKTQAQTQTQTQTQAQAQAQVRTVVPTVVNAVTPTQPQPQPVLQQSQSQPQSQPQPQPQIHVSDNLVSLPSPTQPQPIPQPQLPHQSPPQMQQALVVVNTNNGGSNVDHQKTNNGDNLLQAGSSRWPKAEVQALINLRTSLDQKYQENGPKGPLWEEISAAMRKLGYNRNSKRCKEKWENINKYFKKVKESNKKRPEDSKTCPYFHQLDALYRERNKMEISPTSGTISSYGQPQTQQMNSSMAAILAQPEQQWPQQSHPEQTMEDQGSDNQDDSEDDMDEEDDDDQGSGYEIVANNNVNAGSMSTTTTATRTATVE